GGRMIAIATDRQAEPHLACRHHCVSSAGRQAPCFTAVDNTAQPRLPLESFDEKACSSGEAGIACYQRSSWRFDAELAEAAGGCLAAAALSFLHLERGPDGEAPSLVDVRLDELRQVLERLLP